MTLLAVVRREVLGVSLPGKIATPEIGDRVATVFFVLLNQKAVFDKERKSVSHRSRRDLLVVSRLEIVSDSRGLESEVTSVKEFKNRIIVLPIHPRYTRAHVTRTYRVRCLAVSLLTGCGIFTGNLLRSTVQRFIVLCYKVVTNDHASGSQPESAEKHPDSCPNQEPEWWSSNTRPMLQIATHALKRFGRHDSEAQKPSKRVHRAPSYKTTVRALAVTAANHAHRDRTQDASLPGGGRHAGV